MFICEGFINLQAQSQPVLYTYNGQGNMRNENEIFYWAAPYVMSWFVVEFSMYYDN